MPGSSPGMTTGDDFALAGAYPDAWGQRPPRVSEPAPGLTRGQRPDAAKPRTPAAVNWTVAADMAT